ncbi:unnamed protein product [Menidia menidia]|uniref:(Atlantic silverside) hypothetical protein n=1 Tax=Menidia menidia TaxID=238744 RepID=A0A8S4ARF3_9TELE|nr:unnamed protein product [Menidia menidia]
MLLERARFVKILPIFCAVCHLTVTFPTRNRHAYDDARQLQVNISLSGAIFGSLGSSISIPCLASLSSKLSPGSSPPVVPRIKWTVVSGGVEKEILVARGERLRVKKAYQDRAAMLNYTSSPDDLSLWLGDLRHSDSGHYRCEVQQGLEDASDLIEVKVRGVVFHYRDAFDRYDLTFQQAKEACKAMDAQIATPDQLLAAFNDGFEQCDAGWLSDQSVRYPIHTPREPCYGDMIEKPGVRNYGTMDPEKLFDVYCYAEQMNGEVFHDTVPQRLSFDEAQDYCISLGAKLATPGQLYTAWSEGLDYCSPGWLSDGSVRYPIITPRQHCGGFQPGVKTVYRFTNQTGFPEPSSLYDVYCFKGKSDEFQVSEVTTEAGDTEQNVVILMETDQELKLNQQAEQVEREAQSVLISLPFISSIYTGKTSDTTDPTVISDITDSPSSTSAVDLLHRLEKTSTISSFQQPVVVTHAISSTDSYNPQNNSSYLPAVYNETDQNQNQSLSFQSEFERTTYSPHTQNIVQEVNLEETTPGTEKLKHPQDLHEFNLTVDRAVTNDSEVSSDHTQEEGFWEATTLTVNPMLQGRYEDAEVEDPVQMMTTTHTSQEEGLLPTQAAQTNESATETLTSLWTNMDGSAENSEEKDTEVEGVTFLPSSLSSTGENKVVSTIDYGEEATGATFFVLEGEDKVTPTIDYEEEVNSVTTIVVEGEDKVAPTLEDFSISPLNSQTSKWALLTTTTEPQLSVSDVEFRQKFSSTTASESSVTTKPITGTTKTTSAPITTTHGSRHNLSPATTTKEVFLETAEPQKETHLIPPVDHGLIDVEISLTKLPTLLILPNEGAAVGDAGNSSDACDEDQCLNGGTCFESNKQVKCLCLPTYGGDFCENDLEQCEPGWDKFQGFCYRHFGQRLTWAAAEQHCRMMGAHLASIMSPEEQAFINDNYKEYQWTGLNDKALEDDFVWSDGNPLMYENWYKGQPDSYFQSGEDCVVMVWHDDGRWSDVPCNYHLSYTCKKGTASCGPPPKVRNASPFGKVRQRYGINAIVRYRCAEGFRQKLKPLIRCLSGGRWERPEVLCVHGSKGKALSVTESNFAAAENEFESTTEAPQYWDIKF